MPKNNPENEIGGGEDEALASRRSGAGLVVAILLLAALMGSLIYAPFP